MKFATWIKADGTVAKLTPNNGKLFTLDELQRFVQGHIEILRLEDGQLMVINEEGKLKNLPVNTTASLLWNYPEDVVVGDVLVCPPDLID